MSQNEDTTNGNFNRDNDDPQKHGFRLPVSQDTRPRCNFCIYIYNDNDNKNDYR